MEDDKKLHINSIVNVTKSSDSLFKLRQGWSTDENPFFVAKVVSGIMSGDHGS